jgi:glutamate dehydrogenase/leucine dehydrogenase
MLVQNPEVSPAAITDIILTDHGEIGAQLGYTQEEIVAAFAPGRPDDTYATLEVDGIPFSSFRFQAGVLDTADRSRGGCEVSPKVTGPKIYHKAAVMLGKHALEESGDNETLHGAGDAEDVGGKSGIAATPEELEAIGSEGRAKLMGQHGLAHNISPYTNVTATDIGTYTPDMNAIATALRPQYGAYAGAAASGVSAAFGGRPDIHMPKTGLGGAIMLDRYLRSIADRHPRVAEAINGGAPLRVVQQGLGKAGAHFMRNMPSYVQPVGALEQYGGVVIKDGYLDRDELLAASQATKLSKLATETLNDTLWLPPGARSEFWAATNAEILVPAFDENQVDGEDVERFAEEGHGIAIVNLANKGVQPEGQKTADQLAIDILPDTATNIGGTISSKIIGKKIMGASWWTPATYEQRWTNKMTGVADMTLATRRRLAAEKGHFVPLEQAVGTIILRRAVGRLRYLRDRDRDRG